jgi:hypothetical protein
VKYLCTTGLKTSIKIGLLCTVFAVSNVAHAAMIKVTVTNNADVNGFTFTPVYTAFHNGNFDAFDVGSTASAGVEAIAELGDASVLAGERLAVDPGSVGGVIFPTGAMRPLFPGETGVQTFDILNPANNMFLTYLSMILPSNDSFFGNDDALQIFDASGAFLGNKTINITGSDLWDAGTEALNISAAPFVAGGIATDSPADSNNLIRAAESLDVFAGLGLGNGQTLDANLIDFLTNPSEFNVATITIEEVPEPAAASVFVLGLLGLGFASRRRKTKS